MQQHPIPQNVTQYQFRLVGDMTLKQFLELCIGFLLAYLFYASNLIFIIKWPLIILSILFGAALAFFPIEDRPLDQWITNFLRAIYLPTRFIWQKTNKVPPLFTFEARLAESNNAITKTIKAPTQNAVVKPLSDLSEYESTKIDSLDSLFNSLPNLVASPPVAKVTTEETPLKPTVEVRKLKPLTAVPPAPILHSPPIPSTESVVVEKVVAAPNLIFSSPPTSQATTREPNTLSSPKKITLPASPKTKNLVTGVVVDQTDKLIEGAIVQIVSSDGVPQRAMKTNSLGQFYTSTPLSPGTYIIEVDKEGTSFSPQQIIVNDTILSPIELRTSS